MVETLHESVVYAITPEATFTPSDPIRRAKNVTYKIGSLVPNAESRTVEYKAGGGSYCFGVLPSHVQKYGSAFLNSGGGTLAIGVQDTGVISGVYLSSSSKQRVCDLIRAEFLHFTPPVQSDKYEIEFVPCNKDSYYVIEIHVRPGDESEIYSDRNSKMWIKRDGSVQGPLWPEEIRDIVTAKLMKELTTASHATGGVVDSNAYPLLALCKEMGHSH